MGPEYYTCSSSLTQDIRSETDKKLGAPFTVPPGSSILIIVLRQSAEMGDVFKKIKEADDASAAGLFIKNILPR